MAGIESDALIEMASRGPAADKQVRNATSVAAESGPPRAAPVLG
jgi:hypothetical protein